LAGALSRNGITGVDKSMLRFLAFYTVLMVVIYSLIPYKTPWCLLGFLHGMVLLAGAGAVRLLSLSRHGAVRSLILALLVAATLHLGRQAWAASFPFDSDPRNPYVYAHTGKDVFAIAGRVESIARAHPLGLSMPIQIISRENLWPLPWYLRRFIAVRWWNGVSPQAASAPLILASPDVEPALARKLYELPPPGERELYMNIFDRHVELRPGVELRGYAAKTLWDDYLQLDLQSLSLPEDR
jgi:predicted membrane-bound mannosyltransferase